MQLTFGDRLMLLRKKQKLTKQQLSIRLTIPEQQLTAWENDEGFPSFQQIVKLADHLDASLDFLTCRIDEQPNKQWLEWAAEVDQLSEKNRDTLFYTIRVIFNVDKMDRVYSK